MDARIEAILKAQLERAYQFAVIYAGKWAERVEVGRDK